MLIKKCIWCGANVLPWQKKCSNCYDVVMPGYYDDIVEERIEFMERYKRLSKTFDYSAENVEKISRLNDILAGKMKLLYDRGFEISELFLRLQEEGHEDFYEFTIEGTLEPALLDEDEIQPTPFADKETIWNLRDCSWSVYPQVKLSMDYNSNRHWGWPCYDYFVEEVPHRGVFANPAFDKIKLCPAMDILFNQQKTHTLQDAVYMTADDFQIEFKIEVAKRLWRTEKKYKKLSYDEIIKKTRKHWNSFCYFDWNYDNRMKIYCFVDYTTETLNHIYDEAFYLKNVFEEEFASGKEQFRDFEIEGALKYHNCDAFEKVSKRKARDLCNVINESIYIHPIIIDKNSVDTEDERSEQIFISPAGEEHLNWNVEAFDRGWVGNHTINYFMHYVFVDSLIYDVHDILYMKPEDWRPQFNIRLNDNRV